MHIDKQRKRGGLCLSDNATSRHDAIDTHEAICGPVEEKIAQITPSKNLLHDVACLKFYRLAISDNINFIKIQRWNFWGLFVSPQLIK